MMVIYDIRFMDLHEVIFGYLIVYVIELSIE